MKKVNSAAAKNMMPLDLAWGIQFSVIEMRNNEMASARQYHRESRQEMLLTHIYNLKEKRNRKMFLPVSANSMDMVRSESCLILYRSSQGLSWAVEWKYDVN